MLPASSFGTYQYNGDSRITQVFVADDLSNPLIIVIVGDIASVDGTINKYPMARRHIRQLVLVQLIVLMVIGNEHLVHDYAPV